MNLKVMHLFCALLLAGCTTVNIPPEKLAWARQVEHQVAEATDTHYIYVPVADEQEMKMAESLAHQKGKYTQRIKRDGKTLICVFTYAPNSFR